MESFRVEVTAEAGDLEGHARLVESLFDRLPEHLPCGFRFYGRWMTMTVQVTAAGPVVAVQAAVEALLAAASMAQVCLHVTRVCARLHEGTFPVSA